MKPGLSKGDNEVGEDGLEKAEGDRGGNVIGHTKSGDPIYAPKHGHEIGKTSSGKPVHYRPIVWNSRAGQSSYGNIDRAVNQHKDFTSEEHGEAAKIHRTASEKHAKR